MRRTVRRHPARPRQTESAVIVLARSFLLSLRTDGLRPTLALAWRRLHGDQEFFVFVRRLTPPATPVVLPAETNGVTLRRAQAADRNDLQVQRHEPADVNGAAVDVFVAVRQNRIVGAAWYVDAVTPAQPWHDAVAPHLTAPARFTANIYVRPGEKGAGWALAKTASDVLAAAGVRTIVGMVGATNTPSILLTRMLGGRIVARLRMRHRWGRRTISVEPMAAAAGAP